MPGHSGVAGALAAWCGGQICRPIVLGFGKWIACLGCAVMRGWQFVGSEKICVVWNYSCVLLNLIETLQQK